MDVTTELHRVLGKYDTWLVAAILFGAAMIWLGEMAGLAPGDRRRRDGLEIDDLLDVDDD